MALTNLRYDKNAYNQRLNESVQPNAYLLLPESKHRFSKTCYQEEPGNYPASRKVYRQDQLVDLESDIHNLNRKMSKDPMTKYPYTKENNNIPMLDTCKAPEELKRNYTLLEAPSYKREQQIDVKRFEGLPRNPQRLNRIHSNTYIGENTRLVNRDNYKMKTPHLLKQSNNLNDNWTQQVDLNTQVKEFGTFDNTGFIGSIEDNFKMDAVLLPNQMDKQYGTIKK